MRASAKDLRFHSKELLDTVSRGEEVIITVRGKAQAKLVPVEFEDRHKTQPIALFGIWRDNEKVADVGHYVRTIRKGRNQ